MGIYVDHLEFTGRPPSEAELRGHLRSQVHDDSGVANYIATGRRVELWCLLDPVTRPYALAFLTRRGGVLVDPERGAPLPLDLPPYVDRPWREHAWWRRFRIRVGYLRALYAPPRTERRASR
jgi:hypothetical protein